MLGAVGEQHGEGGRDQSLELARPRAPSLNTCSRHSMQMRQSAMLSCNASVVF
jgi:hypothetical protein